MIATSGKKILLLQKSKFFVVKGLVMEFALLDEVAGVDLGDQRLNARLAMILQRLGAQPHLSIPAAMQGRTEMEAAYRFFANDAVEPNSILSTHFEQTCLRASRENECLLVQDTTEVILTRPTQQVVGAGPMSTDAQRGAFVHPLMAFTNTGIPLGVAWQKQWTRTKLNTGTPEEKRKERSLTPIEDKESYRWIEGLRAAREVAKQCPTTRCVVIGDSESDIYELFAEPCDTPGGLPLKILVRAGQERATMQSGRSILDEARAAPVRYTLTISVSARKAVTNVETRKRASDRPARLANVQVRACSTVLRPTYRPDRTLPHVPVNLVFVEEIEPPTGQVAIEWLLVTTLPIATSGDVESVVTNYCHRWQIELYFKTLKSGCRIEERQFEFLFRELNCIAVYMIIAWRILLLCRLGRECPEMSCEVVFEPSEWKAVYLVVKKKDPPPTPPTLNEIIRMIASLGGYVDRKQTEPGTQTLWYGLQRMHDFANCYDSFGPPAKKT
jgi:hypothetical protein